MSKKPPLYPPTLCAHICSRCETLSIAESWDGRLFKCPGCGVWFTAQIATGADSADAVSADAHEQEDAR